MSAATSTTKEEQLRNFIDNGYIVPFIHKKGMKKQSITCFVSMNESGTVRCLIGGKCPSCGAKHLRNTCNVEYAQEVIKPILKSEFPFVTDVIPVLTTDADFKSVSNSLGYKVKYLNENQKFSKFAHMKLMMDYFAHIDCTIKQVILREDHEKEFDHEDEIMRMEFLRNYQIVYMVEDSMKVLVKGCKVAKGFLEVLGAGTYDYGLDGMNFIALPLDKVGVWFDYRQGHYGKKDFVNLIKMDG